MYAGPLSFAAHCGTQYHITHATCGGSLPVFYGALYAQHCGRYRLYPTPKPVWIPAPRFRPRPGQLRVIKRNGQVVPYTDDKISVATKAFWP